MRRLVPRHPDTLARGLPPNCCHAARLETYLNKGNRTHPSFDEKVAAGAANDPFAGVSPFLSWASRAYMLSQRSSAE